MRRLSLCFIWFFLSYGSAYAWHNQFSVVNNQTKTLTLHLTPDIGGAHMVTEMSSCKSINETYILPPKTSCQFELTDGNHGDMGLKRGHRGTIVVTDSSGNRCQYGYDYIYDPFASLLNKHSIDFEKQQCAGPAFSQVSLVSAKIKSQARPILTEFPLITLSHGAISFAKGDCTDPQKSQEYADNCLIFSPSDVLSASQTPLAESLALQAKIDESEPLNNTQWLGTHNSMISPHYTSSTDMANITYSDPDNFQTLTEQLNSGVRQIEFDILWNQNEVQLCHNHVSVPDVLKPFVKDVLCDGNKPMSDASSELASWLSAHPNQVVFVLLDVNQDLGAHWVDIDNALSILKDKIYTPADAKADYSHLTGKLLSDNTLPTALLSKKMVLAKGRQVIVVADTSEDDLSPSQNIFLHAVGTPADLLEQHGIEHVTPDVCDVNHKYQAIKGLFPNDAKHFDVWRTNGDRTLINYLTSSKLDYDYNDYGSLSTINRIKKCPINIISVNMLGFTCQSDFSKDCRYNAQVKRPVDPRLYAYLWSWHYGYPVSITGADTKKAVLIFNAAGDGLNFVNDAKNVQSAATVLCHKQISNINDRGAKEWLLIDKQNNTSPSEQCAQHKATFATPVTSYQMDDIYQLVRHSDKLPVLVNYLYKDSRWLANSGRPLDNPRF